jgi:hypothetical protein
MFIPNSSFSIAIMNGSIYPSFLSISLAKIYVIVYSTVEYPEDLKIFMLQKFNWIKSIFSNNNQRDQSNDLVEELNVNDQIP